MKLKIFKMIYLNQIEIVVYIEIVENNYKISV